MLLTGRFHLRNTVNGEAGVDNIVIYRVLDFLPLHISAVIVVLQSRCSAMLLHRLIRRRKPATRPEALLPGCGSVHIAEKKYSTENGRHFKLIRLSYSRDLGEVLPGIAGFCRRQQTVGTLCLTPVVNVLDMADEGVLS